MRIGVNALYLIPGGVGGTEIYLRNLLRALAAIDRQNRYVVFTNTETGADLVPQGFEHRPTGVRASNRPLRLLWEQIVFPSRLHDIDVIFNPGFTAPAITGKPSVTVFHDLQHKRHPEHFGKLDLPAWNLFLWLAVRSSRLLLADSQATKQDLHRYYNLPDSRVRVVHLGVEDAFFDIASQRKPEPFLLCVSTLHPHKNIERLVRVFSRFDPSYRLVLAGMRGFHTNAVEKAIADHGLQDRVNVTGWIPREALYDLFRRAAAIVYPSTFEGFGLPVVEAMAAGVPLACSAIEPLQTLVENAAVTFDPHDDESMLAAMQNVVNYDPAQGRERAAQFTWEACARATLAALTEANLQAESSRRSSHRDT